MIAALLLLAHPAQDAPPPAEEEIVVQATYGVTTMLFDKGSDGRLRNCRVMVSSGSQRRDTKACQQTPVCYEKTRDTVTDCVELIALEPAVLGAPASASGSAASQIFDIPKVVPPKPAALPAIVGPSVAAESGDVPDRQRIKLPELPKDNSRDPSIRITVGNAQDK